MKITDISVTKKGRYAIFVDDEFLFSLHIDIFTQARLKVGDEVTVERLEELRSESELKITKERAIKLLSYKSYTTKGLKEKLERFTDEETAEEATSRMEDIGLLDDSDYAYRCARDLYSIKRYSRRRIIQELRQRGIPQELAEEATEQFDEDDEVSNLEAVIKRKYMRYLNDEKGLTKTINALARLGYSYGDIKSAIRSIGENAEMDFEE